MDNGDSLTEIPRTPDQAAMRICHDSNRHRVLESGTRQRSRRLEGWRHQPLVSQGSQPPGLRSAKPSRSVMVGWGGDEGDGPDPAARFEDRMVALLAKARQEGDSGLTGRGSGKCAGARSREGRTCARPSAAQGRGKGVAR